VKRNHPHQRYGHYPKTLQSCSRFRGRRLWHRKTGWKQLRWSMWYVLSLTVETYVALEAIRTVRYRHSHITFPVMAFEWKGTKDAFLTHFYNWSLPYNPGYNVTAFYSHLWRIESTKSTRKRYTTHRKILFSDVVWNFEQNRRLIMRL
jgi:hypothetical protein